MITQELTTTEEGTRVKSLSRWDIMARPQRLSLEERSSGPCEDVGEMRAKQGWRSLGWMKLVGGSAPAQPRPVGTVGSAYTNERWLAADKDQNCSSGGEAR